MTILPPRSPSVYLAAAIDKPHWGREKYLANSTKFSS